MNSTSQLEGPQVESLLCPNQLVTMRAIGHCCISTPQPCGDPGFNQPGSRIQAAKSNSASKKCPQNSLQNVDEMLLPNMTFLGSVKRELTGGNILNI